MTKKVPSPPIAVLLDLLFLLVFILLINSKDELMIEIPKQALFKGAILIEKDRDFEYIVDENTFERKEIFLPKNDNYVYYKPCTSQCKDNPKNKNLYIVFPSDLLNKISKITFIATRVSDYNCKNLRFRIMENGKIDKSYLFKENFCIENIDGVENVI